MTDCILSAKRIIFHKIRYFSLISPRKNAYCAFVQGFFAGLKREKSLVGSWW